MPTIENPPGLNYCSRHHKGAAAIVAAMDALEIAANDKPLYFKGMLLAQPPTKAAVEKARMVVRWLQSCVDPLDKVRTFFIESVGMKNGDISIVHGQEFGMMFDERIGPGGETSMRIWQGPDLGWSQSRPRVIPAAG